MKEIKLTIDGTVYSKKHFTVKDWMRLLEYAQKHEGSRPTTQEVTRDRMQIVSEVLEIPMDTLENGADFQELMDVYREIDRSMTEAFLGAPLAAAAGGEKNAKPQ